MVVGGGMRWCCEEELLGSCLGVLEVAGGGGGEGGGGGA